MKTSFEDTKFDIRTRELSLREGKITKQDIEKYLKSLPDESQKTEEIPVYEEPKTDGSEPTFSAANEG